MEQQEYLLRLSMIEQEARMLEEKFGIIEQQIAEMGAIKASLLELDEKKEGDEVLTNLGKGIFLKTSIKSKDLFLNVGKGAIVKKTIGETVGILNEQVEKLTAGRAEVAGKIEEMQAEMNGLVEEAQKAVGHPHEHDANCECGKKK